MKSMLENNIHPDQLLWYDINMLSFFPNLTYLSSSLLQFNPPWLCFRIWIISLFQIKSQLNFFSEYRFTKGIRCWLITWNHVKNREREKNILNLNIVEDQTCPNSWKEVSGGYKKERKTVLKAEIDRKENRCRQTDIQTNKQRAYTEKTT